MKLPPTQWPSDMEVEQGMSRQLCLSYAKKPKLRWIGDFGKVWRIGEQLDDGFYGDGYESSGELRWCVKRVELEEVKEVEIWKLDSMDLMADRGAGVAG